MKRVFLSIGFLFAVMAMFAETQSKLSKKDDEVCFYFPLEKDFKISAGYGERKDPTTESVFFHNGIDLVAESGTDVYSAGEGKVLMTGFNSNYGNFVIVGHRNGYQTLYANLSKILVEVNDSVTRKTKLGLVGNTGISTGPHLHFAISKDGEYVDPEAHCINLRYR